MHHIKFQNFKIWHLVYSESIEMRVLKLIYDFNIVLLLKYKYE